MSVTEKAAKIPVDSNSESFYIGVSEKKSEFSQSAEARRAVSREEGATNNVLFWVAVGLSQATGIVCIGVVIYWMVLEGGFDWASNKLLFNYHPLFMVLGLVFCYGDAIMVYRVLGFLPKWIQKVVHASLHFLAIVFSSIALAAVFERNRRGGDTNLFSLHSWVGITTFGMFCLQYVGSFITFLWPGLPLHWRSLILPFHTFFGVGVFVLAVATSLMGVTEKLLWTPRYSSGIYIPKGATGNTLGIFMLVFAFLIVFITTHASYKRKPLPSETSQRIVNE